MGFTELAVDDDSDTLRDLRVVLRLVVRALVTLVSSGVLRGYPGRGVARRAWEEAVAAPLVEAIASSPLPPRLATALPSFL